MMQNRTTTPQLWQEGAAISLLLAAALMVMGNATISPALPLLAAEFSDDPWAEWLSRFLVPAPSAAVVICAPFAGRLADRVGRRRLLLWGVALFAIAGCAGLVLPDLRWILASRLVLGIGMALIMTAQTALLGDLFDGARRANMQGLMITARNLGGLVCITSAGVLATWSVRLPFGIYALAFVFLWVMWHGLVEDTDCKGKGTQAQSEAVSDTGAATGWRWVVAGIALLQGLTNLAFFVMPTQLPFFLNDLGIDAPIAAGLTLGAMTLAGAAIALRFGALSRWLGTARCFALGYGIMAVGYLGLSVATGFGVVVLGAICVGMGYSLVTPSFAGLMLKAAPMHWRGRASGVLTTAIFVGQLLSPLLSVPIIGGWGFSVLYSVLAVGVTALAAVWAMYGWRDAAKAVLYRQ